MFVEIIASQGSVSFLETQCNKQTISLYTMSPFLRLNSKAAQSKTTIVFNNCLVLMFTPHRKC